MIERFTPRTCLVVILLLPILLTSCSHREINANIVNQAKDAPRFRIGLVSIKEPDLYEAKVLHHRIPNPTVTIPGRIASQAMIVSVKGIDKLAANYNLTHMLKKQEYSIAEHFSRSLKMELAQVGYEVLDAPLKDHRHASDFRGGFCLNEPPLSEPCSNYYLHVVIDFAGYVALLYTEPYVPLLKVRVQVVSVTGKDDLPLPPLKQEFINQQEGFYKLIYAATFTYGGLVPVEGPTDVVSNARFALRSKNDLDNTQKIIAGLEEASQKIAERIALNLK